VETTGAVAGAGSSPFADAAKLGLSTLAEMVARTEDGIAVVDGDRRYVYANPSACRMLGRPLAEVRGRLFLDSFPGREHAAMRDRLPGRAGDPEAPFTCSMVGADGAEHEVVCFVHGLDIAGVIHAVAILQDVTDPRVAARTAAALAQTTAQLVGAGTVSDILERLSRHVVDGTRALACAISVAGDDHEPGSAGAYVQGYGAAEARAASDRWVTRGDGLVEGIIEAMTAGAINIGGVPGKPVVLPDGRSVWEADPRTKAFAPNSEGLDWQAAVYIPLSWENRVFGFFSVFLPVGLTGPSEAELAFYVALADQAAVAATNARLQSRAGQAAALLERTRLARELHDSVSQALFSMTMHARAAQLSMDESGLEEAGPLGESIAQLGELARGAMAEMRALIFELRPGALVEEGLVGALRKQGAALTAREQLAVTVDGPEERLGLRPEVEEHLYRIISEALHNVVKHARAGRASVSLTDRTGLITIAVSDDGIGFGPGTERSGHLGLSTMAQRALAIGADLAITSTPGHGTTVTISLADRRRDERQAPVAS
jgi:PAS domain S-box-containing protein